LYLPSTDHDVPLPEDDIKLIQHKTIEYFSKCFGGATMQHVQGGWFSEELNKVIVEPITIVYSYASETALKKYAAMVLELADNIKKRYHQESMAIEIDNNLYIV
jgi:hypothetical protein